MCIRLRIVFCVSFHKKIKKTAVYSLYVLMTNVPYDTKYEDKQNCYNTNNISKVTKGNTKSPSPLLKVNVRATKIATHSIASYIR